MLFAVAIDALMTFTVRLGPQRVQDRIQESQSENYVHPCATALRQEPTIETEVPREVDEFARHIRRDLFRLEQHGPAQAVRGNLRGCFGEP